jgi:hypothetical protein
MATTPEYKFPFDHAVFINLLFRECRGLRHLTSSYDMLHDIFSRGSGVLELGIAKHRLESPEVPHFGRAVQEMLRKEMEHLGTCTKAIASCF